MNEPSSISLPAQTRYARQLAERREVAKIEQLANFGLAVGWVLTLLGGFCWFCVVSRLDWIWLTMLIAGLILLSLAVVIPELLDVPCRLWMKLAHLQGWLVMTVFLTAIYYMLITPVGWFLRRRGTQPFYTWDQSFVPEVASGWEPIPLRAVAHASPITTRRRSLLMLLVSTVGFFYDRGHYFVLPILILLLILGIVLFFVQGSVLAPFIYTIF
jgi:hypothetical protein